MDNNIDILGRTVFGEGRGEPDDGKKAIACVAVNRAARAASHPHFGDGSIASACQAPWQFSCWNGNDPNRQVILNVTNADPVFSRCLAIASLAVNGLLPDITGGATYYEVIGTNASWAEGQTPCAIIGHHAFYKDIA